MSNAAANSKYRFEERWAPELKRFGHVQVSTFFLENYHRLKPLPLTHGEAMFVVHLMQYKWGASAPFPAYRTLAMRMAVSVKTARRLAASLSKRGYLWRNFRFGQTNEFHLEKLMAALVDCALDPDKMIPPAPLKRRKKK